MHSSKHPRQRRHNSSPSRRSATQSVVCVTRARTKRAAVVTSRLWAARRQQCKQRNMSYQTSMQPNRAPLVSRVCRRAWEVTAHLRPLARPLHTHTYAVLDACSISANAAKQPNKHESRSSQAKASASAWCVDHTNVNLGLHTKNQGLHTHDAGCICSQLSHSKASCGLVCSGCGAQGKTAAASAHT